MARELLNENIATSSKYGKQEPEETCWACGAAKFQNRYHAKGCKWCVGSGDNAKSLFDTDRDRKAIDVLRRVSKRMAELIRSGSGYDPGAISRIWKEEEAK